jgi:hypothetical protein
MRNVAMLVGVAALLSVLFASAALALIGHQCAGSPCTGTNGPHKLYERGGNGTGDRIYGRGGGDVLLANEWTRDKDVLRGSRGRDRLNVNDGDTRDTVSGGKRFDICIVDSRGELGGRCEAVRVK